MIDLNRFHNNPASNTSDNDMIDPDLVAKQRRQMIAKIKSEIREQQLSNINTILKK